MTKISLAFTFLIFMGMAKIAVASGVFMLDAASLRLQSALVHASDMKQLSQYSCDVVDQDSQSDIQFCGSSVRPFRCFADVH
jgi:hypothetical protein